MSTITTGVEFRPLVVPDTVDAADAGDFLAMVEVRNQVYREISGHDDHSMPADELLPHYRPDPDEVRLVWVVVDGGSIVGRVGVDLPTHEGSRSAYWLIELLQSVQGRGIGALAYELVEQASRENGRTVLQSWAEHPAAAGERIAPPTGFGELPLDRAARFYRRHGYSLEQVERNSALDLTGSFETIERLYATAREASAGYRVVQWSPPTPPEFAEGYGWMKSRMNTDAPAAGMEFDEEEWDAARVARHDSKYTEAGRLLLVTAAQHIATGELCAFNELAIGKDRTAASSQEDTLVLKEHRGHRLGMLVKCAGLLAWRDLAPESPRMITYNAEENRPMLDINEAIGFVPVAYEGAWKKELS
ncbi:GNAT family N-acetyltransferase [Microbacterium terricola]|uniref:GNAT family N-acetyltransferase n=1 Tax=Microbacterium terricola TaxID=344163 RepID=A0ABM8DZ94_9MICO|nr:GNAT family N-acetyltransferase [Microbacterium terricola]UYK41351.1 GNAT family N-acetyltransferase [Microbacterium terricola]BDV30866.1 GNAT family N-acetyltransferase [Microbacterium terricola]